jgi:putative peptide zinc metalloprotease protein
VFPFNRPAPPGLGDNQTLAVNTRNGTVVYDVAFAMVWADSNTVLNKNEAYAFAHCQDCQATAISFQVLLIVGQAHVIVPQNISEAVNYECVLCLAQALAVQLVVTLPDQPSQSEVQQLTALWQQIQQFGQHLQGLSFTDIRDRLTGYEQQIQAVLQQDSGLPPASGSTPVPSPSVSDSAVTSDSATPAESGQPIPTVPTSPAPSSDTSSAGAGSSTVDSATPSASPSPTGS